jgi:hypothetical protein
MSRYNNVRSSTVTPFCGHCSNLNKRAGRAVHDTRHWSHATPDACSEVVCPELRKVVCRWCDRSGHSIGYCYDRIATEARLAREAEAEAEADAKPVKKPTKSAAPTNRFAVFCDDDQDAVVRKAEKAKAKAARSAKKTIIAEPSKSVLSLIHPDKLSFLEALNKPVDVSTAKSFSRMISLSGYVRDKRPWADQSDDEN